MVDKATDTASTGAGKVRKPKITSTGTREVSRPYSSTLRRKLKHTLIVKNISRKLIKVHKVYKL